MRTRKLGLLLVCLLFGTSAWAQSITRQSVVLSASGRPVPGAKIYVCTGAVTVNFQVTPPCSPAQTIYSDYATTQPITQPLVSDGLGNYLYYLPTSATTVTEVITGTGINSSSTVLTFAAGGGGTPGGTNTAVQFNASGAFGGDLANFFYNSTNHTLNITNLSGTAGDFLNVTSGLLSSQDMFTQAATAATSGANQNSPGLGVIGNYWTGTASANDSWSLINVFGTGANPQTELQVSHNGSTGHPTISFENSPSGSPGEGVTLNFPQSGASCSFATPADAFTAIYWQMCVNGTDLQWEHPGSGGSGRFHVDSDFLVGPPGQATVSTNFNSFAWDNQGEYFDAGASQFGLWEVANTITPNSGFPINMRENLWPIFGDACTGCTADFALGGSGTNGAVGNLSGAPMFDWTVLPRDGFTATFQHTLTANRTFTYPDDAGTFMLVQGPLTAGDCLDAIDAWTAGDAGAACGSGGGGTPGGTNTAVQFNSSGVFGGDAAKFFFNDATGALTITGAMTTAASSFVLSQLVNPANAGDAICGNSTPVWADCVPGVSGRTVSVTTDTLTNSDRQQMVTYNSASAVATSIATAASLGNSYVAYLRNVNSGTVTITPAVGSSINNGSSATVPEGYHCTLSSQDNVNYDLDCSGGILSAGTNITITPGPFGQTISATGGGGGLSGMTAGQIPVAATATTVTSSKALAGTDADIATAAGALTNGAIACGDANGGVTTTGCTGGSNFGGTNTQTTSYTLASSDAGKLVVMNCAAACVLTAPATQPSTTFSAYVMSTNSNATFALGADTYNGTTTVPLLLPFTILKISADSASATNYVGAYNGLSFDGAHTATITPASGASAIITAPSGDSLTVKTQGANSGLTLEANGGDAVVGSLSSTKHAIVISGLEHSNITVTFSATPAFNAGQDEVFEMTLTGNVTSSTITNLGAGEFVTFSICQDATGGHTFAFPTSPTFRGAGTISSGAGTCSTQRFWYDGTDVKATAAMVTGE